jgi:hypothetical protein
MDNYLAPLPLKGEFHSKNAKIVHFWTILAYFVSVPPLGVRGLNNLNENLSTITI